MTVYSDHVAYGVEAHDCYVREGWEVTDRGLCPVCGTPVTWDEAAERWVTFDGAYVLVLTGDELATILDRLDRAGWTQAQRQVRLQRDLQDPPAMLAR